jgi:hypothetical protein
MGLPVIVSVMVFALPVAIAGGILFKVGQSRFRRTDVETGGNRCQIAECPRLNELVAVYRHAIDTALAARGEMERYANEHN